MQSSNTVPVRGREKKRLWFQSKYDQTTTEKIQICKFFSTSGRCRNGRECPFSHEESGGQTIQQPCRFLIQAPFRCTKGNLCHFSHDLTIFRCPSRFGSKEGACIPFCKFDHSPIVNEKDRMEFARIHRPFLLGLGQSMAEVWEFYLAEHDEIRALSLETRCAPSNFFNTVT